MSTENPITSLQETIPFDVSDWGATHRMAWVYGIVCGWDEESLEELSETHSWSMANVNRLRRLHNSFKVMGVLDEAWKKKFDEINDRYVSQHKDWSKKWIARAGMVRKVLERSSATEAVLERKVTDLEAKLKVAESHLQNISRMRKYLESKPNKATDPCDIADRGLGILEEMK